MKRVDLIRHLEHHGVQLLREGGNHVEHRHSPVNWNATSEIHRDPQRVIA